MNNIKFASIGICFLLLSACTGRVVNESNDSKVAQQQEQQQLEASAQIPPARITNWNEKRMAILIQEMRDQEDLVTWTYTKNMDGKYTFVCESISYGLPYDTRTNNPLHYEFLTTRSGVSWNGDPGFYDSMGRRVWGEHHVVPQPEPNGLFLPESAHGTWNMCKNPYTGKMTVSYQEEDVAVFTYRLPPEMVEGFHPAPLPPENNKEKK